MADAAKSVAAIEYEMRFFAPVLHGARIVPYVGSTLAATPSLLTAAKEMSSIASDTLRLMLPTLQTHKDAPFVEDLLLAMQANGDQFTLLAQRSQRAQQALDQIQTTKLISLVSERVTQLQSVAALMTVSLRLAPEMPLLMGVDHPQSYLLLVQNNHELRATGGFISAVGRVTVDKGNFGKIDLTDSYNVTRNDVNHPPAPEPMRRYMKIDLVFLRDANWSPDFPSTAKLVSALYAQDAGVHVDGVVTVDLRAVQLLVGVLGSLRVPGADQPVTADNLIEQLKQFWDRPLESGDTIQSAGLEEWWKQRKDFMPALAQAALARLKNGHVDYLAIAHAAYSALDERAVQVWLDNPTAATELSADGWDGGLRPNPDADYLALVDMNMGYNKVDAVLQRSIDYTVTWPDGPEQPALATAIVTYKHPVQVPNHVCDPSPHYGTNYDDMIQRCYFDYVRLYVPAGSQLVEIKGVEQDSVTSQMGEENTQVLAGHFQMPPGTQHSVTFVYKLPLRVKPAGYKLVVRRQSGSASLPITINVAKHHATELVTGGFSTWPPQ